MASLFQAPIPFSVHLTSMIIMYQGRTDRGSALSIVAKDFVLTDGGTTAYAPDGDLISVSELVANENGQPTFFR